MKMKSAWIVAMILLLSGWITPVDVEAGSGATRSVTSTVVRTPLIHAGEFLLLLIVLHQFEVARFVDGFDAAVDA